VTLDAVTVEMVMLPPSCCGRLLVAVHVASTCAAEEIEALNAPVGGFVRKEYVPGPAWPTLVPPTIPVRAPARTVVDPAPAPHVFAWVRMLHASPPPLMSSRRMPEIAVGPRDAMLLQVEGARMTAAPFAGVKPPKSGGELPDPQAASETRRIAAARFMRRA
jgi:hypothetical protein